MSHEIVCPFCSQRLEAERGMLGKRAECPACGKPFTIPKKPPLSSVGAAKRRDFGTLIFWVVLIAVFAFAACWLFVVKGKAKLSPANNTPRIAIAEKISADTRAPPRQFPSVPKKLTVKDGSFVLENINLHRNKDVTVRYAISLYDDGNPGPNAHNVVFYAPYIHERNFFKRSFHRVLSDRFGFTIFSLEIVLKNEDIGIRDKYYCFPETGWHEVVFKAQEKIIQDFGLPKRKLLVFGESAGGAMAQLMGIHSEFKIDAVAIVGGGYFDMPDKKNELAWLVVNTWGCPGDDYAIEFQETANMLGMQILKARTPPLWHQKSGDENYHHSPSSLALGLLVEFIRSCAELREANGGIMPPVGKWPVSETTDGKKLFFPSEKFLAMWKTVPRWLPEYFESEKIDEKPISYSIPGMIPDKVAVFIHDPQFREAVFDEDNIYYLAERGAMVFSLRLTGHHFNDLKRLGNLISEIIDKKETADLPIYVGGSGSGGMLAAVAALNNGSKRIKKITTFNSELDWPFPELSIRNARMKNKKIPMELVFDRSVEPPEKSLELDWKTVSSDGAFFGNKWFPLLETIWLGNCEKTPEKVLMRD